MRAWNVNDTVTFCFGTLIPQKWITTCGMSSIWGLARAPRPRWLWSDVPLLTLFGWDWSGKNIAIVHGHSRWWDRHHWAISWRWLTARDEGYGWPPETKPRTASRIWCVDNLTGAPRKKLYFWRSFLASWLVWQAMQDWSITKSRASRVPRLEIRLLELTWVE